MKEKFGYTVDSPFFSCRVDQYQTETLKLSEFMKIMIKNIRQVCKDLKQCAKSIETFGLHLQNGLKGFDEGENNLMILLFKKFGEIFNEVASSQDILSISIERTFTEPLEIFNLREIASTLSLIQFYNSMKETNENLILKYLQSDVANFGRGLTQTQLEQRAYDVVQHKRKYETIRYDLITKMNEVEAQKSYEFTECCVSGSYALRTHFHLCLDKLQSCEAQFAEFQRQQQIDKAHFLEEVKPLVRKRRDLTNVLDAMVERVELASPQLTGAVNANSSESPTLERTHSTEDPSATPTGPSTSWQSMTRMGVSWGANILGNLTRQSQNIVNSTLQGGGSGDINSHHSAHEAKPRRSLTPIPPVHHEDTGHTTPNSNPPVPFGATCEECEARMKALDSSELVPLYQPTPFGELLTPGIVKQGFLWKRNEKHKMIEQWKRLWFVLDETKLFYVSDPLEDGSYHAQTVCDLMLASVRERKNESELPFSFEIAFANYESTVVQAEGQKEYLSWITDLRNTIGKRLTSGDSASVISKKTKHRHSSIHSASPQTEGAGGAAVTGDLSVTRRRRNTEQIALLFRNNLFCAECDRDSPEWVSLNLGCLVCIDCSGVHRSMGVHISKMRSLTLDDLEVEEYLALQEAGNLLSNTIWEASVPLKSFKKPDRNSSYSERDKFIRAKYEQRLFLDPPYHEDLTEEELTTWVSLLVQGSADGTPVDILNALAHGVDLTTELTFPPNQYPLHLACQKGSLICVYLLVMNGIDILERNESGLSGFEIAEFHGHKEIAALLKKRLDVMRTLPKYKNETMAIASTTAMSNPVAETPIEGNEQASSPPGPASDNDSVRLDSKQISSFSQLESSQETTTDFTSPDPDNPFYDEDLKMI